MDDEKTYFPMALLRSAVHVCDNIQPCKYCAVISKSSEPTGELYAGYDPGGLTDFAALVVVQKVSSSEASGKKTSLQVVLTKTFLAKDKDSKSPEVYTQFTAEIADLHNKLRFRRVTVDSTGVGAPILNHCKELKLPAEGLNFTRSKHEEVLSNMKILLEQKRITLPDNLDLLSSLNCITAKRNRIGAYIFDHATGTHDDLAHALALAVWGARTAPVVIMNVQ